MSRLLLIALDAGDGPLVRRFAEEGRLPFLASIAERGSSLPLRSIAARFPDAVWPTIATGCLPGTTGHYSWRCVPPGTGDMVFAPNRCRRRAFWELLDDDGRRVVLADVPRSSPISGATVLVGWGQRAATHRESSPPELYADVVRRHGRYPDWLDTDPRPSMRAHARFLRTLERAVDERTVLLKELLGGGEWDVAVASYPEAHNAGHAFHRYLDPAGWPYDARRGKRFGDALLRSYQAIDRSIEAVVGDLGGDVDLLVFSGAGLAVNTSGAELLPTLLERLGYFTRVPASPLPRALGVARRALPWSVRRHVNRRLTLATRTRVMSRMWSEGIDWPRTRAIAEAEFSTAWVRVNLRGREPRGIVEPGDEYERLRDDLIADVRALVDAETGEPAALEVLRREEVVSGPHASDLPDIFIRWAPGRLLRTARHPEAGVLHEQMRDVTASEHHDGGFLIAAGPRLSRAPAGTEPNIADLAPTVLALAGTPIPSDMEGRPIEALIAQAETRRAPIRWDNDPWAA